MNKQEEIVVFEGKPEFYSFVQAYCRKHPAATFVVYGYDQAPNATHLLCATTREIAQYRHFPGPGVLANSHLVILAAVKHPHGKLPDITAVSNGEWNRLERVTNIKDCPNCWHAV